MMVSWNGGVQYSQIFWSERLGDICVRKYGRVEWTIVGDLLRDTREERYLKEEVWQSGVDYSW